MGSKRQWLARSRDYLALFNQLTDGRCVRPRQGPPCPFGNRRRGACHEDRWMRLSGMTQKAVCQLTGENTLLLVPAAGPDLRYGVVNRAGVEVRLQSVESVERPS